jgi:hypothetical protein
MNIIDLIKASLVEVKLDEVVTIKPQQCSSFDDLIEVYKQDMSVTPSLEDCMAVCMAVHIAVALDGDPLWTYLVGAPSSGKSTICELLCSDELHTTPMDGLTGIVSGDRKGKHLVPLMQGKCVVVKDGTLLLESNPLQLANVYSELRCIFDGSLVKHFRNGVSAEFNNVSFGMIIGITERVYSLNMAALGERFLHCRLETTRDVEKARNAKAVQSIFEHTSKTNFEGNDAGDSRSFPKQRAYTAGFLSHLHSTLRNNDILRPGYTDHDVALIQSLADMIACSRAQAPRSKEFGSSELLYDARPEASTRVVKQLSRLALCLCYVLGTTEITQRIRVLLTKVALDTAFSRQHNIIRTVALAESGLTRQSIAVLTSIPLETITRRIDDLISLGILIPNDTDHRPVRGRTVPTLKCARWIQDAFRLVEQHVEAGLSDSESPITSSSESNSGQSRHPQKKRPIPSKVKNPAKR